MKILDIAFNDIRRSVRSMFAIGMMVVVPLAITGLIYFAFGGVSSGSADLPATRVVVVNQDVPTEGQPAMGQMVVDMLSDPSVSTWLEVNQLPDEASARAAVDRQEAGVAVLIPGNFSASLLGQGETAQIVLVQDPTLSIGPTVVENMITSLLDGAAGARTALTVVSSRSASHGAELDDAALGTLVQRYQAWFTDFQRSLYHSAEAALVLQPAGAASQAATNPIGRIMGAVMAGQMIFFAFYTGGYSMMSILKEQEEGTLARMFTTPTDRTIILAGKFAAVVLTVIGQTLVLLVIGRLAFNIHWGQPGAVALAVLGQVVAASGLGVLLISLLKTSQQSGPVLGGVLSGLGMLGGLFTVAVSGLPELFIKLTFVTPQGWVLQGWKTALDGGSPAEMLLPLAVCLGLGVVMFFAGAFQFRQRFA